jgi:hypothetical protein
MTTPTARVRLDAPGALVAAVPYLLGFVPARSLVAVALRRGQVCLTLRVDLTDASEPGVAAHLVAHVRRSGAGEVVLVLVGEPAAIGEPVAAGGGPPAAAIGEPASAGGGPPAAAAPWLPHRGVVAALRAACRSRHVAVRDVLWTDRGRWWSYLCRDPGCCGPAGTPVDREATRHLAAELAAEGRGVLPDRRALERSVAPVARHGQDDAAGTFARVRDRQAAGRARGPAAFRRGAVRALAAAIDRCGPGGPGLSERQRPALTLSLTDTAVRDRALRWLGGARHDGAQALLLDLTRHAPPPWAATPAVLLAMYAYSRGDGAFARVCADRALSDDPGCVLAAVVHRLLDGGVSPGEVTVAAREIARRAGRGTG